LIYGDERQQLPNCNAKTYINRSHISTFRFTNRNKFSLIETKGVHVNNDDFCFIRGFFPDKKYINLSSQGYMREESMVIQNTKKNSVI